MIWVAANLDPRITLIQDLLDKTKRSERWLARKLNTSPFNIGKWLDPHGHVPRDRSVYDAMIQVLTEETPGAGGVAAKVMRSVVVHLGQIPAGDPTGVQGDIETIYMKDWGNKNERWGRPVTGTSMIDALIPNDIAIFEERQFNSGDVCHVFRDGTDAVKCVRRVDKVWRCYSFNDEYEPFPLDDWKVKGVCVARIRKGPFGIEQETSFGHGLTWAMKDLSL